MLRLEHESNVDVLRQAAVLLERENKFLVQKNMELQRRLLALQGASPEQLAMRIAELEQQLAQRNRILFGDKADRRAKPDGERPAREPQPKKGHGPRPQPQLPIVDVIHQMDEPDRVCGICGGELEAWEGQFEESEEVDVLERHFVLRKHKRQKYRCRCGACIETAPGPTKLFEGARYSIDFAIEVAVQKYLDHLPLERQVRIMGREGLVVDSQTLWDQIERMARLLKDVPEAVHRRVLSRDVVCADETPWRLMGRKRGPPDQHKRCWVWSVATPDGVYYRILRSRSSEAAAAVLGDFRGVVMCDGLSSYVALARERPSVRLAHCWAHARRRFVEIQDSFPRQTQTVLNLIEKLYEVERTCPAGAEGDDLRRRLRAERSAAIVQRIRQWALTTSATPESALGKAIAYMTGMWSGLTRFLDDPKIPIDNNLVERALRDPVLGRKNHYGSRSKRGLEVASLYYTILHTAKTIGVDPKEYLRRAVHAALRGDPVPLLHDLLS
jgi:transposase